MKRLLILSLLATAPALAAPPRPLTSDETGQLRCVAALAIVAHEQDRGAAEWRELAPLGQRGAHFSGVVGDTLVKASGQSRDAVRDAILSEVAAFQKAYPRESAMPEDVVTACIAMMDRIDPPPPPPSITHCAALISLAQTEMQAREGMTPVASKLTVYASLLNQQAREAMRLEGKSEAEGDMILGLAREAILDDTSKRQAAGENAEQDFESCLAIANQPKVPHVPKQH